MEDNKDNNIEERLYEMTAENEELCAENADLKARLDEAIEDKLKAESLINTRINDKIQLLHRVKPYIGDVSLYTHYSNRSIMEAAINCIRGDSSDFANHSDDVVKGIYLECIKNAEAKAYEKELNAKYNTDEETSNDNHDGHLNRPLTIHEGLAHQLKDDFYKSNYGEN